MDLRAQSSLVNLIKTRTGTFHNDSVLVRPAMNRNCRAERDRTGSVRKGDERVLGVSGARHLLFSAVAFGTRRDCPSLSRHRAYASIGRHHLALNE